MDAPLRVCAVSYLNTVPLIWGMQHGEQTNFASLRFAVPSECARQVAGGEVDLGIVPVIEVQRHGWQALRTTGIASRGPVRSILLVSKVEPARIRTLAADCGSRTSVMLARILLANLHGSHAAVVSMAPNLDTMLLRADAALLIGDAALRVDPTALPYLVMDLGEEWTRYTGLPMVFALWAGPRGRISSAWDEQFLASCRFGLQHIDDIVRTESDRRRFDPGLVRRYLTTHIQFELDESHWRGLELYWEYAARLESATRAEELSLC